MKESKMRWSMLVLTTSLLAVGCGGDNGEGGPPTGSGGGGGSAGSTLSDGGEPEAYAPEPGVCKPLCCADTDCAPGDTCQPLDPGSGTLGTCSAGWAGDAGTDPDAGTTSPEGGATFPQSCWTVTQPECNPLTNESCAPGGACDVGNLGDSTTKPVVACFYDDNIQGPGEECDNVDGPFCIPGYHCAPN